MKNEMQCQQNAPKKRKLEPVNKDDRSKKGNVYW